MVGALTREAQSPHAVEDDRGRIAKGPRHQAVAALVDQDRDKRGRDEDQNQGDVSPLPAHKAMISQKSGCTRTGMSKTRNRRSYAVLSGEPSISRLSILGETQTRKQRSEEQRPLRESSILPYP